MSMETHSGGCQCGAVRFRLTGTPGTSSVCYCRMCQKASAAHALALVSVGEAALEWTRGQPSWFQSSNAARRGFCDKCGTPLAYDAPDGLALSVLAFDDPDQVAPTIAYGTEVYLFDTTLRDGQQTPGIDFSVEDKIAIAELLDGSASIMSRAAIPAPIRPTRRFLRKRTKSAVHRLRHDQAGRRSASNDPGLAALISARRRCGLPCRQGLGLPRERWRSAAPTRKTSSRSARRRSRRSRRRQGGDGRLRAFLRRLQGQSRVCARLCADGLRGRRALGRAVRHQWRHPAFGDPRDRRRSPGMPGDRLGIHAHNDTGRRWPIRWPPWMPACARSRARSTASASAAAMPTWSR
jgi:hypothetical protein